MARTRHLIAVAAVSLAGAVGITINAQGKSVPSCVLKGSSLVVKQGNVQIIATKLKPQGNKTRRTRIDACWTPTGKHFQLQTEEDFGLDLITSTQYTITDGRYVGAFIDYEGGISDDHSVKSWDVKTRKLIATSKTCDNDDQGDSSGPSQVAFGPNGAFAMACDQLIYVDAKGDHHVEPKGTLINDPAIAGITLYYTVFDKNDVTKETIKGIPLAAAAKLTP